MRRKANSPTQYKQTTANIKRNITLQTDAAYTKPHNMIKYMGGFSCTQNGSITLQTDAAYQTS
jgi:hypothetical protein